jgi:RNA polymerase sigma factor (sigma-70 family)
VYPIDRLPRCFCPILEEFGDSVAKEAEDEMTTDKVEAAVVGLSDQVERITAQRAKFLSFLSARVEDRATAEDILQSAYLKAVEHGSEIRDDESTVAWFYRILRNAITDHYRRRTARTSAHEAFAAEMPVSYEAEVNQTVCACIGDVIHDLKSEYRAAIEQVDLGGMTVEAFAQSQQTSANNASVRLHRARKAVAKKLTTVCGACAEHKCLDCTCRRSQL